MPDTTKGLLTNFGIVGNLDSMRGFRGDLTNSNAFARSMYDFESEHAKQCEEIARQISSRLDEYRAEKRGILSADRLQRRSILLSSRRQLLQELAEGRDTNFRQIVDFRRETRRQAETVIPRADLQRLHRVREPVVRDLMRLVHGDRAMPVAEALDHKDVPEHIRSGRHNPPFAVVPPYPWSWTTFYHWFSSGSSEVTNWYVDGATGRAGHRVAYQNFDPGDSDWCNTEARSLVGFTVPAQGAAKKWRFWIDVACGASRGLFRWEDEFGSSITHNHMLSNMRITISTDPETPNLLHHPYERFKIWDQDWHGDDDWYYPYEFRPPGWTKTYVWTTPVALPSQSAFVSIGTADYTSYWLDDVTLDNIMNNRWTIQKVVIELVN